MRTIHQQGPGSNLTNTPSGETAGEESGAPPNIDKSEHRKEGEEAIDTGAESDAATHEADESAPLRAVTASDRPDESAPATAKHGLTALAHLRAYLEERDLGKPIEGALSIIDAALRRPHGERTTEDDDDAPASGERSTDDDDTEPPTSRILPPPLSTLAIRLNDRAMLVSLEDAEGYDLSGREIVHCLVLTTMEAERALKIADAGISDAAARILGSLPKGAS